MQRLEVSCAVRDIYIYIYIYIYNVRLRICMSLGEAKLAATWSYPVDGSFRKNILKLTFTEGRSSVHRGSRTSRSPYF